MQAPNFVNLPNGFLKKMEVDVCLGWSAFLSKANFGGLLVDRV